MTKKKPNRKKTNKPYNAPKISSSVVEKSIFRIWIEKHKNIFYSIVGFLITITGFTVYRVLPDNGLTLINPTDPNRLVVALKNNSLIPIKNIRPQMFVDTIMTREGDDVNRLQLKVINVEYKRVGGGQTYTFDYDLNNMFFLYNHRPEILRANLAIQLKYKFFTIECKDNFFFECKPDFHGNYLWVEMPEQPFVEEMEKATGTASFSDIPATKRQMEQARREGINTGPPPPVPRKSLDDLDQ